MATRLLDGQRTWSLTRGEDGHRTYRLKHLIEAAYTDGPANVLQTAGLPLPGAPWIFDADIDLYAWCRADAEVVIHEEKEGDKARFYAVTQVFSTKPPDKQRCHDVQIEDPLLEPPTISGSFVRFSTEGTHDRHGVAITNSAFEQIRGPQNEWDDSRLTVHIEHNVADLQLALIGGMNNTLNDSPLWGYPARCWKLTVGPWSRKFQGACQVYYTRSFDFEVNCHRNVFGNLVSGWDRDVLDEATKVLNGHWHETTGAWTLDNINGAPPDPSNPKHFIRAKDRNGENMSVILNGAGVPISAEPGTGTGFSGAGTIPIEYYRESNFLLLGIPIIF